MKTILTILLMIMYSVSGQTIRWDTVRVFVSEFDTIGEVCCIKKMLVLKDSAYPIFESDKRHEYILIKGKRRFLYRHPARPK